MTKKKLLVIYNFVDALKKNTNNINFTNLSKKQFIRWSIKNKFYKNDDYNEQLHKLFVQLDLYDK